MTNKTVDGNDPKHMSDTDVGCYYVSKGGLTRSM